MSATVESLAHRLEQGNRIYMSQSFHQQAHLADDPIARALVAIGDPAVPELKRLLYSGDRVTRDRAARA